MILVVGSSGLVGGMITRMLLARGDAVRILVRRASPLVDAGAIPVYGDLKDPSTLVAACRDVDVVISPASAGERGGDDTPQTVDFEGPATLTAAARAAGVRQFISVSALIASEQSPAPLGRAKAQAEAALRASGMSYTILAPHCILDVNAPLVIGSALRAGHGV